jgi:nucleotide-binding universal stress UspA family protein/CheY-like chemotaxis protein
MKKEILVPVDGSEDAARAIEFAIDMARRGDATIHLLHVVKRVPTPKGLDAYIRAEGLKDTPDAIYFDVMANQIVDSAEAEAKARGAALIHKQIIFGDPPEEIVKYANDRYFDMIVMGSRGMGRVTRKVCRETDRTCVLVRKSLLDGKRTLIVDDEPDILDTLAELLSMCKVVKAASFEEAAERLETEPFDIAVLDIMGVDGYRLLGIAKEKGVIPVMLTAHALSPEDTVKSFKEGAASYVPKEKMAHIATYLNDVLEAKEKGKHFWWRWIERFGTYYEKRFGSAPKGMTR